MNKLDKLNARLDTAVSERDKALRELRAECAHTRLAEDNSAHPPMRICVDCGAEERGWGCGYQVLTLDSESNKRKVGAGIVAQVDFTEHRLRGPLFRVGQSHKNFGPGRQTYAQLTEQ